LTILAITGGALLFLFLGVLRSLAADEAKGWIRDLSMLLIDRAVAQLPTDHRDEKRAEWRAEYEEQSSKPISSLMWSWRLYRLRRSTAHELRAGEASLGAYLNPEPITKGPVAPEELHPYLRSLVDGLKAFGWQDIAAALRDPTLGRVDARLDAATARFFAVIDEARAISNAPPPRFGPPRDSYAWHDVYDPEPPKLRRGFAVTVREHRRVIQPKEIPPKESWSVRLLRTLLTLSPLHLLWIMAPAALLASGLSVSSTLMLMGLGLLIAISTPLKRLAILFSFGMLIAYDSYLWSLAMEHGLFEWEEGRMVAWTLFGLSMATLVIPDRVFTKLRLRR
jgi:hypothetical protein